VTLLKYLQKFYKEVTKFRNQNQFIFLEVSAQNNNYQLSVNQNKMSITT